MSTYDEATAFLGNWGRFQQIIFFLLCFSATPNGARVMFLVFATAVPRHHCLIPEVNLTEDWLNAVIPKKVVNGEEELSRCSRYRLDVVRNLSAQGYVPGRDVNLTDLEQESCVDGWSYSTDIYQSTVVSEFDLVCGEQWKQPFTSALYFTGILIASFCCGQLSDRFGRKPVFFVSMALQPIITLFQFFSPSWTVFIILMFFNCFGEIGNYTAAFVLGTEVFSGNVRTLFSTLGLCMGFAIGYMVLSLVAYFLRDWRYLLLVIALHGMLYIILWWLIPESPRWLLSQGRVEEAEAIVRKAAHKNKVEAPQIIFEDYIDDDDKSQKQKHHTVCDLIRTRKIRFTTFILCLAWFVSVAGYYGLTLNTSKLAADPYLSAFISGAVEIPAYICSWLSLQFLPRRLCTTCTLFLGGVALYLIQAIPKSLPALSVALEMLGKFGFTANFSMMYAYTTELNPTVLRNTAIGTCSTFSRVGSIIAPFLLQLSAYFKYLPYIILGTLAVMSAILIQFLSETFGQPLPETIQEMHKWERMKCPCITQKEAPTPVVLLENKM
ncbi:solute carrier family 22 member 5-like [Sphaeramia orbicularis]|uniref:solute carrier family 22 member 5-like n=1 Tax=Sphaeramia orbicularis TaxID=375764 RepID=UPI00117DF0FF|nr:solute carrier family 22 member 5-like [Sphaeramia orbicularis]